MARALVSFGFSCFGVFAMVIGSTGYAQNTTKSSVDQWRKADQRTERLLDQIRLAMFPNGQMQPLLVSGTTNQFNANTRFVVAQSAEGCYRQTQLGPLKSVQGYDGQTAWESDWHESVRKLQLSDRDRIHALKLVQFGAWLAPSHNIKVNIADDKSTEGCYAVEIHFPDGRAPAVLQVDRESHLVSQLTLPVSPQDSVIEFHEYSNFDGVRIPSRIRVQQGGNEHSYHVVEARIAKDAAAFDIPESSLTGITFSTSTDQLTIERAASGHVLVELKIGNQHGCWFILDTGAGGTVVDERLVKRLKATNIGQIELVSMFGVQTSHIVEIPNIDAGAIHLNRVFGITMNLSPVDAPMGREISGIIGYDLFSKCVASMKLSNDDVRIYDPRLFNQENDRWKPLLLDARLPLFPGQLDNLPLANYRIDIGASGDFFSNVVFHYPYCELNNLAATYGRSDFAIPTARFKVGHIERFRLGQREFENMRVGFALDNEPPFNEKYSEGNVGIEILKHFEIVLDYSQHRYSFEGDPSTSSD